MLKININERSNLDFEVEIHGIEHKKLNSRLRFIVNEIEYGFPVEIDEKTMSVEVPPLSEIIKDLESGQKLEAKLEIFGEGLYLNPWTENLIIEPPVEVKVKLKDKTKGRSRAKLVTKINEFTSDSEKKEPDKKASEQTKEIKEQVNEKVDQKIKGMESLIDGLLGEAKKKPAPPQRKSPITEESIFKYMGSAGLKNKRIQEVILNKAKATAENFDDMKQVLVEVKKILKR